MNTLDAHNSGNLAPAIEDSIARLEEVHHSAVSSFITSADAMIASIPEAESSLRAIASDIASMDTEVPPNGEIDVVSEIQN